MTKPRFFSLLFFITLFVILLPYFFLQTKSTIPPLLAPTITKLVKILPLQGEVFSDPSGGQFVSLPEKPIISSLVADVVKDKIQEYRSRFGYTRLANNQDLDLIAQRLADTIAATPENYEDMQFKTLVAGFAKDAKTTFGVINQLSVMGPTDSQVSFAALVADEKQSQILLDSKPQLIAVATSSAEYQSSKQGITVILLAKFAKKPQFSTPTSLAPIHFKEISDTSMLLALNEYRKDHGVPQLVENQLLCQYAQKRVNDLVAFGGLDEHQGFKKDFADPHNLPESIQQYPGGKIGENLAYQHCRNMTTGDGFVAETATALIEWCFDSSTKGHREAQLNPKFTAACTRHKNGLFVVIFGE